MIGNRIFATVAIISLFGCSDNQVICTAEARASLTVTVTDTGGMVLTNYELSYTLNGEPKEEFCISELESSCSSDPFEIGGNFTVTASKPGYKSGTIAVTVEQGVCHVITEHVVVVLESDG